MVRKKELERRKIYASNGTQTTPFGHWPNSEEVQTGSTQTDIMKEKKEKANVPPLRNRNKSIVGTRILTELRNDSKYRKKIQLNLLRNEIQKRREDDEAAQILWKIKEAETKVKEMDIELEDTRQKIESGNREIRREIHSSYEQRNLELDEMLRKQKERSAALGAPEWSTSLGKVLGEITGEFVKTLIVTKETSQKETKHEHKKQPIKVKFTPVPGRKKAKEVKSKRKVKVQKH